MEELNLTPEFEEVIEAAPEVVETPAEPEYVEVVDVQFRPGQGYGFSSGHVWM